MIDYETFRRALNKESVTLEQRLKPSQRSEIVRLVTNKGAVEVEVKDGRITDILDMDDGMRWEMYHIMGPGEYIISHAVQKSVFYNMLAKLDEKEEIEALFKSYLNEHKEPEALNMTYAWMGINPSVETINGKLVISASEEGPHYLAGKITGLKDKTKKDLYRRIYLEHLINHIRATLMLGSP